MLLPFDPIERRRQTARGTSLGAIADGLTRELSPWLGSGLPLPETKARLTRVGGRCPAHGTLLAFDPASPWTHACTACGKSFSEREHHEWWAMGAHLFTAERTVHASALYLLRGDPAHRDLAVRTLRELAQQYPRWPNVDNVLGPSRPFFSTYLESIWLLNLCHALALLEAAGVQAVSDELRAAVLAPSSALIASYPEGRSNRQVWNEVAMLSAWVLLGDTARVTQRLHDDTSIPGLLRHGLLTDGTWFEGENYHQFAHRGLWYGVQLLAAIGYPLDDALRARYTEGFATPFAGMLPDETLPSRRDSQYAVSLRQWRWAEWCELGYAYGGDVRLAGVLHRLYDGSAPPGETGRASSTADAERNHAAVALSRADCSWRALLMAKAEVVPVGHWTPASQILPRQGLAVLRRDAGEVYVGLEGGAYSGGHGHPDRLALTFQRGGERWLDDPGTGSYVERTLHWYRSTAAHHAPLVNGASQARGTAAVTAFEDRGGAGWVQKRARNIGAGVDATRTVVVCDGYLVDVLEWEAPQAVTVTLPVAHGNLDDAGEWTPASRPGAGGLEDGFEFLSGVEIWEPHAAARARLVHVAPVPATPLAVGAAPGGAPHDPVRAWYDAGTAAVWWRAVAPGAPGQAPQRRLFVETNAARGRVVGVWSWGKVTDVRLDGDGPQLAVVTTSDGTVATHEFAPHGWHIGLTARHSRSSIDLESLASLAGEAAEHDTATDDEHASAAASTSGPASARAPRLTITPTQGAEFLLGEAHYVPTEEPWGGANAPTARIHLSRTADELLVRVHAMTSHPPVVPPGGDTQRMPQNPLDNERADVNADGLQCYIGRADDTAEGWSAAVLAVPLSRGEARVTSLVPSGPVPHVGAEMLADGWHMELRWSLADLPAGELTFDLIVNERPPHRERRRGQLVLGGARGFGYLRGDRHDRATALRVLLG